MTNNNYIVEDTENITKKDLIEILNRYLFIKNVKDLGNNRLEIIPQQDQQQNIYTKKKFEIGNVTISGRYGYLPPIFTYYKTIQTPGLSNKFKDYIDDFIVEWLTENNFDTIPLKVYFEKKNITYILSNEIIVDDYYNFLQKINKYIDFFGLISIVILFYSENEPKIEFNNSFKIIEILKQSTNFIEKNFKFENKYYILPTIYFLANNKIYETLNVNNYENHKLLIFFEKLKKDNLI